MTRLFVIVGCIILSMACQQSKIETMPASKVRRSSQEEVKVVTLNDAGDLLDPSDDIETMSDLGKAAVVSIGWKEDGTYAWFSNDHFTSGGLIVFELINKSFRNEIVPNGFTCESFNLNMHKDGTQDEPGFCCFGYGGVSGFPVIKSGESMRVVIDFRELWKNKYNLIELKSAVYEMDLVLDLDKSKIWELKINLTEQDYDGLGSNNEWCMEIE